MRGRRGGGPPTDLLVCLPARAHLNLMPKPLCSPSRPSDAGKRCPAKSGSHRCQASPLFKTKTKQIDIPEPTSPKVTCAGKIKVSRPKTRPAAGGKGREKKPRNWMEALGIKKEFMQFLGALRGGFRLNMQCFGSFHDSLNCPTDDEDDEGKEEDKVIDETNSKAIISKWFMVLEENQGHDHDSNEQEEEKDKIGPPPPENALLLMRCRSAPAKEWLEEEREEEVSAKMIREEEKEKMVLMSYAPDFFKVSTEIAKETWVAGSLDPLMARSRSWRR